MTILLNGEERSVAAADVEGLIAELELPAFLALVEHNGEALQRRQWVETKLHEGDRIEVVRIVSGG